MYLEVTSAAEAAAFTAGNAGLKPCSTPWVDTAFKAGLDRRFTAEQRGWTRIGNEVQNDSRARSGALNVLTLKRFSW
jgi:hypothetical protein